jgi:acyl-CoA synthetase (AMP-forming)/AMP-acid ligase II
MATQLGPNLADLLLEHPFGDDAALLYTVDRSLSAGAARRAARTAAEALRAAGVQPGQAVAVQLPNGLEAVTTMFGVWMADAVFVPVNDRAPTEERNRILETIRPAALVTAAGVEPLAEPASFGDGVAFVLWTSGTTGVPKAILHTHEAYYELLDRVLGPLRAKPRDPARPPMANLVPVALALNAGIYNLLFGLRAGAPVVIMGRFETQRFADLVRRFNITSTVLPPAAISMLCDDPAITELSPLKYVRSITAPLSPIQARRFTDQFGVAVLNGYGQAEIGEVIGWTAADTTTHPDKVGAVGRPHPGVEIRIVGDDGQLATSNEVGELCVRPPRMAVGYAAKASSAGLGERVDPDGFVRTGDLARVDDDGFVWIEGRIGDVINRGGNKVFPEHVEEVLRLSPGVRDVAVVGVPDDRLGEVPVAFLVGDVADDEALDRLCREHLVPYKVPSAYHRVEALPRNDAGKILRPALVRRHQAQAQAG